MVFSIICLDGFKYSYLKKTKFLKSLAEKSQHGALSHDFGYASEFSAITGKNIEELGIIANNFAYTKENGLKFFKLFSFLDKISIKKPRILLDIIYNSKEFLIGNCQPKSIFNVPLNISNNFEFLLKKNFFLQNSLPFKTIFDIFREKNKTTSAYMWPFIYKNNKTSLDLSNLNSSTANTDDKAFRKSLSLIKENPEIAYFHFFSTDNLVHKLGTKSEETEKLVNKLDSFVEELSKYSDKILIFSDHGMTDVKETIDIRSIINKLNLKLGKDYLMFLDSTLARFWFYNDTAKKEITSCLKDTKKGKFAEFKNKEIHKKFGELIFQANPGITIAPNFYSDYPDKATHGYSNSKDELGLYIFHNPQNQKKILKNLKIEKIFDIVLTNM